MKLVKIVHLELLGEESRHYYFGSLKSCCDMFSTEMGITYPSLRVARWENDVFRNRHCIIRKGVLITSTRDTEKNRDKEVMMKRIAEGGETVNQLQEAVRGKKGNRHRIKKGETLPKKKKTEEG